MFHTLKTRLQDAREKRQLYKELTLYAAAISDALGHQNVQKWQFRNGSSGSFIVAPELESLMLRSGHELTKPVVFIDTTGLYLVWFKDHQMKFLKPRHLTPDSMRTTKHAFEASIQSIQRKARAQRQARWLFQNMKRLEAQRQRLYNTLIRDYNGLYQLNGRK